MEVDAGMDASIGRIIISLDSLARTGWMLRGVPSSLAETVSSHLFASALIALESGFRMKRNGIAVDPYKAAAIALVHDLAESLIGDIAKVAGIDKSQAEARAFERLNLSLEVKELFREYEEANTVEAILARASEAAATYIRGCYFKELGYGVDEILDSMRKILMSYVDRTHMSAIIDIVNESFNIESCIIRA